LVICKISPKSKVALRYISLSQALPRLFNGATEFTSPNERHVALTALSSIDSLNRNHRTCLCPRCRLSCIFLQSSVCTITKQQQDEHSPIPLSCLSQRLVLIPIQAINRVVIRCTASGKTYSAIRLYKLIPGAASSVQWRDRIHSLACLSALF
jgi:hypothetical protein